MFLRSFFLINVLLYFDLVHSQVHPQCLEEYHRESCNEYYSRLATGCMIDTSNFCCAWGFWLKDQSNPYQVNCKRCGNFEYDNGLGVQLWDTYAPYVWQEQNVRFWYNDQWNFHTLNHVSEVCRLCHAGQKKVWGCVPGVYSTCSVTEYDRCEDCEVGKFTPNGPVIVDGVVVMVDGVAKTYDGVEESHRECYACVPGKFQDQTGSSECRQCDAGKFSGEGQSVCDDCVAGKYSHASGQSDCSDCEAGKYSITEGRTSCILCDPGKYKSVAGTATCESCAAGKFSSLEGTVLCVDCEAGKFSNDGSIACVNCEAGKYQKGTGKSFCVRCRDGKTSYAGATSCGSCPIGAIGVSGSCSDCSPGSYWIDSVTCGSCTPGKFAANSAQTVCDDCPTGKYVSAQNALQCSDCDAGKYNSNTGSMTINDCLACIYGQFSSVGSSSCTDCPSGKYGTGAFSCHDCNFYEYTTPGSFLSSSCNKCEAGFTVNEDQSGCSSCIAGKRGDKKCKLVQEWVEVSENNFQLQYVCHSYNEYWECTDCEAGKYSTAALLECLACPPGQISSTGDAECTDCEAGKFETDRTSCTPCEPGNYSNPHMNFCLQCPAGKFSNTSASVECMHCPQGKTSDVESVHCHNCLAGFYSPYLEPSCLPCFGTRTSTAGSASCFCKEGLIFNESVNQCQSCPENTCAPRYIVNPTQCEPKSVEDLNDNTCHGLCDVGYEMYEGSCRPCSATQYKDHVGNDYCDHCPFLTAYLPSGVTIDVSYGNNEEGLVFGHQCECPPAFEWKFQALMLATTHNRYNVKECQQCQHQYFNPHYNSQCQGCPELMLSYTWESASDNLQGLRCERCVENHYRPDKVGLPIIRQDCQGDLDDACRILTNGLHLTRTDTFELRDSTQKCIRCPDGTWEVDNICMPCSVKYPHQFYSLPFARQSQQAKYIRWDNSAYTHPTDAYSSDLVPFRGYPTNLEYVCECMQGYTKVGDYEWSLSYDENNHPRVWDLGSMSTSRQNSPKCIKCTGNQYKFGRGNHDCDTCPNGFLSRNDGRFCQQAPRTCPANEYPTTSTSQDCIFLGGSFWAVVPWDTSKTESLIQKIFVTNFNDELEFILTGLDERLRSETSRIKTYPQLDECIAYCDFLKIDSGECDAILHVTTPKQYDSINSSTTYYSIISQMTGFNPNATIKSFCAFLSDLPEVDYRYNNGEFTFNHYSFDEALVYSRSCDNPLRTETTTSWYGRDCSEFQSTCESCTRCPEPSFSFDGAQSILDCKCPAGWGGTAGSCERCSRTTYKDWNGDGYYAGECQPCPAGKQSDASRTACFCGINFAAEQIDGRISCRSCEYGKYKNWVGDDSCKNCPQNAVASAESAVSECECAAGFYLDGYDDVVSDQGQISWELRCVACPASTFKAHSGNDKSCSPCGVGYDSDVGSVSCFCAVGYYQNFSSCVKCPEHMTSPRNSLFFSSCACIRGFYHLNSTLCQPCAEKSYTDQLGMLQCISCPENTFSSAASTDIADCKCPKAYRWSPYMDKGMATCIPCPPNSYNTEIDASFCQNCTHGMTIINQNETCQCMPGFEPTYYGKVKPSQCEMCRRGSYKIQQGNTSCTTCPPTRVTNSSGATSLAQCLCPPSHYHNMSDVSQCISCPNNLTTTVYGAHNVSSCVEIPVFNDTCGHWVYSNGSIIAAKRTERHNFPKALKWKTPTDSEYQRNISESQCGQTLHSDKNSEILVEFRQYAEPQLVCQSNYTMPNTARRLLSTDCGQQIPCVNGFREITHKCGLFYHTVPADEDYDYTSTKGGFPDNLADLCLHPRTYPNTKPVMRVSNNEQMWQTYTSVVGWEGSAAAICRFFINEFPGECISSQTFQEIKEWKVCSDFTFDCLPPTSSTTRLPITSSSTTPPLTTSSSTTPSPSTSSSTTPPPTTSSSTTPSPTTSSSTTPPLTTSSTPSPVITTSSSSTPAPTTSSTATPIFTSSSSTTTPLTTTQTTTPAPTSSSSTTPPPSTISTTTEATTSTLTSSTTPSSTLSSSTPQSQLASSIPTTETFSSTIAAAPTSIQAIVTTTTPIPVRTTPVNLPQQNLVEVHQYDWCPQGEVVKMYDTYYCHDCEEEGTLLTEKYNVRFALTTDMPHLPFMTTYTSCLKLALSNRPCNQIIYNTYNVFRSDNSYYMWYMSELGWVITKQTPLWSKIRAVSPDEIWAFSGHTKVKFDSMAVYDEVQSAWHNVTVHVEQFSDYDFVCLPRLRNSSNNLNWKSFYGDCDSYLPGHPSNNHLYCQFDGACPECPDSCGKCIETTTSTTAASTTPMPTTTPEPLPMIDIVDYYNYTHFYDKCTAKNNLSFTNQDQTCTLCTSQNVNISTTTLDFFLRVSGMCFPALNAEYYPCHTKSCRVTLGVPDADLIFIHQRGTYSLIRTPHRDFQSWSFLTRNSNTQKSTLSSINNALLWKLTPNAFGVYEQWQGTCTETGRENFIFFRKQFDACFAKTTAPTTTSSTTTSQATTSTTTTPSPTTTTTQPITTTTTPSPRPNIYNDSQKSFVHLNNCTDDNCCAVELRQTIHTSETHECSVKPYWGAYISETEIDTCNNLARCGDTTVPSALQQVTIDEALDRGPGAEPDANYWHDVMKNTIWNAGKGGYTSWWNPQQDWCSFGNLPLTWCYRVNKRSWFTSPDDVEHTHTIIFTPNSKPVLTTQEFAQQFEPTGLCMCKNCRKVCYDKLGWPQGEYPDGHHNWNPHDPQTYRLSHAGACGGTVTCCENSWAETTVVNHFSTYTGYLKDISASAAITICKSKSCDSFNSLQADFLTHMGSIWQSQIYCSEEHSNLLECSAKQNTISENQLQTVDGVCCNGKLDTSEGVCCSEPSFCKYYLDIWKGYCELDKVCNICNCSCHRQCPSLSRTEFHECNDEICVDPTTSSSSTTTAMSTSSTTTTSSTTMIPTSTPTPSSIICNEYEYDSSGQLFDDAQFRVFEDAIDGNLWVKNDCIMSPTPGSAIQFEHDNSCYLLEYIGIEQFQNILFDSASSMEELLTAFEQSAYNWNCFTYHTVPEYQPNMGPYQFFDMFWAFDICATLSERTLYKTGQNACCRCAKTCKKIYDFWQLTSGRNQLTIGEQFCNRLSGITRYPFTEPNCANIMKTPVCPEQCPAYDSGTTHVSCSNPTYATPTPSVISNSNCTETELTYCFSEPVTTFIELNLAFYQSPLAHIKLFSETTFKPVSHYLNPDVASPTYAFCLDGTICPDSTNCCVQELTCPQGTKIANVLDATKGQIRPISLNSCQCGEDGNSCCENYEHDCNRVETYFLDILANTPKFDISTIQFTTQSCQSTSPIDGRLVSMQGSECNELPGFVDHIKYNFDHYYNQDTNQYEKNNQNLAFLKYGNLQGNMRRKDLAIQSKQCMGNVKANPAQPFAEADFKPYVECYPCPPNSHSPGGGQATAKCVCDAGYVRKPFCLPANFYLPYTLKSDGYVAGFAHSAMFDFVLPVCNKSQYDHVCEVCPKDTYQATAENGTRFCVACPRHYISADAYFDPSTAIEEEYTAQTASEASVSLYDCKCRTNYYLFTTEISSEMKSFCVRCPDNSKSESGAIGYDSCKCDEDSGWRFRDPTSYVPGVNPPLCERIPYDYPCSDWWISKTGCMASQYVESRERCQKMALELEKKSLYPLFSSMQVRASEELKHGKNPSEWYLNRNRLVSECLHLLGNALVFDECVDEKVSTSPLTRQDDWSIAQFWPQEVRLKAGCTMIKAPETPSTPNTHFVFWQDPSNNFNIKVSSHYKPDQFVSWFAQNLADETVCTPEVGSYDSQVRLDLNAYCICSGPMQLHQGWHKCFDLRYEAECVWSFSERLCHLAFQEPYDPTIDQFPVLISGQKPCLPWYLQEGESCRDTDVVSSPFDCVRVLELMYPNAVNMVYEGTADWLIQEPWRPVQNPDLPTGCSILQKRKSAESELTYIAYFNSLQTDVPCYVDSTPDSTFMKSCICVNSYTNTRLKGQLCQTASTQSIVSSRRLLQDTSSEYAQPETCVLCDVDACEVGFYLTSDCMSCAPCTSKYPGKEFWYFSSNGDQVGNSESCDERCPEGMFQDTDTCKPFSVQFRSECEYGEEYFRPGTHLYDSECITCDSCVGMRLLTGCTLDTNAVCERCPDLPNRVYIYSNCTFYCSPGTLRVKSQSSPSDENTDSCEVSAHVCETGTIRPGRLDNASHCEPCPYKPLNAEFVSGCTWQCPQDYFYSNFECTPLRIIMPIKPIAPISTSCLPGLRLTSNYVCEACIVNTPSYQLLNISWQWKPYGTMCEWECMREYFFYKHSVNSAPRCLTWNEYSKTVESEKSVSSINVVFAQQPQRTMHPNILEASIVFLVAFMVVLFLFCI